MLEGKPTELDAEQLRRLLELRPELAPRLGPLSGAGLPDPSAEARRALLELLREWRDARDQLAHEQNADPLTFATDQRVFSASLELLQFTEEQLPSFRHDPDVLAAPLALLIEDHGTPGRNVEARFSLLLARLLALPGYLAKAQAAVDAPDVRLAEEARQSPAEARATLAALGESARSAKATGALPAALAADVEEAVAAAAGAVAEHERWLASLDPIEGAFKVGEERLDRLLLLRGLDITASEMAELARSMVEEMRIEERRLLKRFFRGVSVQEALAHARSQAPLSGEELCAWASELAKQARDFVGQSGIFPLPPGERVVVEGAPAGLGPLPFGALLVAGVRGAELFESRLLVPQVDAPEQLARYSVADLEGLVAFHAYPGAHLMRAWSERRTSLVRAGAPAGFAAGVAGTFGLDAVLGWAHYVEELMRELSFRDAPGTRLVSVRAALKHAVLAYVDVALARGAMTPARARALLVEDGGASPEEAARSVRALLRRPSEGLSPLLGKMRLTQLRQEAKDAWRAEYTDRRLHELVLFGGPMPLAYHFELLDASAPVPVTESTLEYSLDEIPVDPEAEGLAALVEDIAGAPAPNGADDGDIGGGGGGADEQGPS